MIFPLFKTWLRPWLGTALGSSRKAYKTPSGFRTIGGGGGSSRTEFRSRGRRGAQSPNPITANMTFNESEERIVTDIKMQTISVGSEAGGVKPPAGGIVVSKEVEMTVTTEDGRIYERRTQRVGDGW